MTTTLAAATAALRNAERRGDARVIDATHDSREVRPGWLFCAVAGSRSDGHDHAPAAVAAGATALLVERWLDLDVPQVRVDSVRAVMGPVAAQIHAHPSAAMRVVGVTGTNGKTTTSYLLEGAFGAAGIGTGVVGTVEVRIHGAVPTTALPPRTTPEATDLQRLLAVMRARGVDAVAMEVSSHGLDQHRVDGTRFAVAVFTNLTQDHLDYHGSLDRYHAAKARLFTPALADRGVVCVDDDWGRRVAAEATIPVITFGSQGGDHVVEAIEVTRDGTTLQLRPVDGDAVALRTRMLGRHNAMNAAGAFLAATLAGIAPDAAASGIAGCAGVPGRLEPVDGGQPYAVLVDYAHTPDALRSALVAARDLAGPGRVHVVVGCGGDRDRGKRPMMGVVAATLADHAVLTSDNPRNEDPAAILDEMLAGARTVPGATVTVEVDRTRAIRDALRAAEPNDVVVIAGKGHETGQEFADATLAFDDRVVAAGLLAELAGDPR